MKRDTKRASGRFVLRLDPSIHAALRSAARAAGLSLNDYCARTLASPGGAVVAGAADVVRRAAALCGDRLVGVALYGSYVRSEAEVSSDVDVLVVVDRALRLTRALYRKWDEAPISWERRLVEPHFVHPLEAAAVPSGLWAEVAIDGIVLFERELRLSRTLVRVRHDILAGRLVRRVVHGQPYWAEAS